MQRRLVKCKIDDNVTVAESKCVEEDKPTHRQECTNVKCVGKWKVWRLVRGESQEGTMFLTFLKIQIIKNSDINSVLKGM
jgi:hypothetical protein